MIEMSPVILCGNSFFMCGLALTLVNQGNFLIVRINDPAELEQKLSSVLPAAVLVDAAAGRQWFLDLVRNYPDLLIIAVNPDNSTAAVYSQERVNMAADLNKMIVRYQTEMNCSTVTG